MCGLRNMLGNEFQIDGLFWQLGITPFWLSIFWESGPRFLLNTWEII